MCERRVSRVEIERCRHIEHICADVGQSSGLSVDRAVIARYLVAAQSVESADRNALEHIFAVVVLFEFKLAGDRHAAVVIFAHSLVLPHAFPACRPAYAVDLAVGNVVERLHRVAVDAVTQSRYLSLGNEKSVVVEMTHNVVFRGIESVFSRRTVEIVALALVLGRKDENVLEPVFGLVRGQVGALAPEARTAQIIPFFEIVGGIHSDKTSADRHYPF